MVALFRALRGSLGGPAGQFRAFLPSQGDIARKGTRLSLMSEVRIDTYVSGPDKQSMVSALGLEPRTY